MKHTRIDTFFSPFLSICSLSYALHWFFGVLLVLIVLFLVAFTKDTQAILLQQSQMPLMEFHNFNIYEVNTSFVQTNVKGKKALRYQEYEVAYDMVMSKISDKKTNDKKQPFIEYMYGEEITKVGDVYSFHKGGVYARDDGQSFWSEKGIYNTQDSIFRGSGKFWLMNLSGEMNGLNIIYNQNLQTMQAESIQAKINLASAKQDSTHQDFTHQDSGREQKSAQDKQTTQQKQTQEI